MWGGGQRVELKGGGFLSLGHEAVLWDPWRGGSGSDSASPKIDFSPGILCVETRTLTRTVMPRLLQIRDPFLFAV